MLLPLCSAAALNRPDREGLTPLHFAVLAQRRVPLRCLLARKDILVDPQDNYERTPVSTPVGFAARLLSHIAACEAQCVCVCVMESEVGVRRVESMSVVFAC